MTQVGFDCLSDLDTNVKDGYECHDGLSIWYRLGLIVYLINVKDGYECHDGLSIWYRLVLIVYLIWTLMLRIDTNVVMDYQFDISWVWLIISSGY